MLGTGKTMSVICSALQWVLDRRRQEEEEKAAGLVNGKSQGSDDEPDWMRDFVVKNDDKQFKEVKRKNKKEKSRSVLGKSGNDIKKGNNGDLKKKIDVVGDNEEEFLLEEYESEDEKAHGNDSSVVSKRKASISSFCSSSEDESDDNDEDDEEEKKFKVYFCSRTHSQLSQFVKELRKTVFADEMGVVSLGSRKNLCINKGLEFCLIWKVLLCSPFGYLIMLMLFRMFLCCGFCRSSCNW